jgi:uncharacterized protein involved in exopolysaccharide biosynthesis
MQAGLKAPHSPPAEQYAPASTTGRAGPPPLSDAEALRGHVDALRRHPRLLIGLPLTLGLAAMAVSIATPRTYAAHAAFLASEPSSLSGSLGALSSVASQLGIPGLSAVASGSATLSSQFYGDLVSSNALVRAIVTERYDARAVAENGGMPFAGTLVEYVDPDGKTPTDQLLAAMEVFRKRILSVSVDRPTGIVRLEVRTKNRQLSALVARRLLDLVNDFNLKRRQTQAGAEREFVARRTRAALDSLRVAEATLADFRAANIDFSRSPRLTARETELQRRVTLAQQIYTTVAQRYELANIEAVRNTPIITVLDAPEGLVEARPRYTLAKMIAAFLVGLLIATVLALRAERLPAPR